MIVGATHGQQMGEGRRPQSMTTRFPILNLPEMPPQYKSDGPDFKSSPLGGGAASSGFDHNKNSLGHKESPSSTLPHPHPHAHTSLSAPHPQPFTASWLTEVARMTPLRPPERLPFPSPLGPSVADYYQHYQNLTPRSHLYPPPFLTHPQYLRDFPHARHHLRNFSSLDLRTNDHVRRPSAVPGVPPSLVRPLGPPPPPSTSLDLRDQRGLGALKLHSRSLEYSLSPPHPSTSSRLSPKEISAGDSSKMGGFQPHNIPSCSSLTSKRSSPCPSKSYSSAWCSTSYTSVASSNASGKPASPVLQTRQEARLVENPPEESPFHSHFRKGSLVTVGEKVRKVEELVTEDFVEAADAAEELSLDPSTVGGITPHSEKGSSTITFVFPSTRKKIPVEAADDHPFFVFHRGWSSCNPRSTLLKYDLKVRQLVVGDICVSLRKRSSDVPEGSDQPIRQSTNMPPPKTSQVMHGSTSTTQSSTVNVGPSGALSSATTSTISLSFPHLSTTPVQSSLTGPSPDGESICPKSLSAPLPKPLPMIGAIKTEKISLKKHAALFRRPSSRTAERFKSSEEGFEKGKEKGRMRRWSDPEH